MSPNLSHLNNRFQSSAGLYRSDTGTGFDANRMGRPDTADASTRLVKPDTLLAAALIDLLRKAIPDLTSAIYSAHPSNAPSSSVP